MKYATIREFDFRATFDAVNLKSALNIGQNPKARVMRVEYFHFQITKEIYRYRGRGGKTGLTIKRLIVFSSFRKAHSLLASVIIAYTRPIARIL